MQQRATDYHSDRMSETSDKNGYHFPYTAEEDHLTMMSRNHSTTNDMNYPTLSKLASRHGSRGSSPPSVTGIQPLAPLTSITDTSEWVVIVFNFFLPISIRKITWNIIIQKSLNPLSWYIHVISFDVILVLILLLSFSLSFSVFWRNSVDWFEHNTLSLSSFLIFFGWISSNSIYPYLTPHSRYTWERLKHI